MNGLWIALRFLTRIPAPEVDYTDKSLADSVPFYGWVGVIIGLLIGGSVTLLHPPALLGAAISIVLLQWLSGGLHLDGLADCADAWVGGRDVGHTLAIMKDPHIGAMGTATLICTLLLQFSAVAEIDQHIKFIFVLICTCSFARSAAAWLLITTPYVRPNGLGEPLTRASAKLMLIHNSVQVAILAALAAKIVLISVVSVAIIFLIGRAACIKRIGGITGDTLGALIVLAETLTLCAHALS